MPKSKTDFTNFVDARPNYFPGQFLLEDDFEVEQKYLIDRQKYHRQSLHVSVLVEGLEVEVIKDKQEVQIKSGSAINSNGDLIILKKDTSFSQFAPLTNGELYISYKEEKQVKQQEDFTRWQEVPTIGFAATTPNEGVKLAKISIVNNVLTLDLTVRDYSGIFLPNATGNDLTLRSGGNANPNVAILNGSLTVTGTFTVNNKIAVLGNQKIEFSDTDITNNLKLQLSTGYGLGINDGTLFYAANGKHSWRDVNGANERMVLTTGDNGFLTVNGTGTSSFAGNLKVTGTITGKIDATNINSGVLAVDRIPDLSANKIASGVLAVDRIPNLPADKITAGTTTGNLTIGGNLRVTGSLTADNKITVPGNQKIEFTDADVTNNLKLQLWSGYGLGINSSTLFYAANGKHSWRDNNGNERMMLTTGADGSLTVNGTGTSSFAGNLRVSGAITPSVGNTESNGIMFPLNPGGGGGDAAWIRYWARSGEATTFEIGTSNDTDDHIALMPGAGNVGIGTTTPSAKLEVSGNLIVTGTITGNKITVPGNQKIEFTDANITNNLKLQLWTGYGLGINDGTLFYAANGKHSWRDVNGANERMVLTTGDNGFLTVNGTGTSSFAGNLKVNNVFLGDLGHGSEWAGFSHSSQVSRNSYALLQNNTGTHTLINKKAGDGYIGFRVDNNDRMVINSNGNVGIGTTDPTRGKVHIEGSVNFGNSTGYRFLRRDGVFDNATVYNAPYSLYANSFIGCQEFNAFSDLRIKEIKGNSNSNADLQTLLQIQVTDYYYKDKIANGNRPKKKVIGQQIAAVYPQAVSTHADIVPDILQLAVIAENWVTLNNHNLKIGDKVKIFWDDNETKLFPVEAIESDKFKISLNYNGDVFAYGREVDDFHVVDYDALSMLHISATQEIYRMIKKMQSEVSELKKQNHLINNG